MKVSDNIIPGSVSAKPKNLITESLKKAARENWITLSIPLGLIIAAVLSICFSENLLLIFLLLMVNIFSIVIYYYKLKNNQKKFVQKFRADLVPKLLLQLDPSLEYEPESFIAARNFNASGLFKMIPNHYIGDNYIKVMEPDYVAEFSYVNAMKELTTTSEDGSKSSSFDPIFEGVFYLFSLPVSISAITIIRTDKTQGILGYFNEEEELIYGKFGLVEIADSDFEKTFQVYSNHQSETLKLLDPNMIKLLLEIKKKYVSSLQISIIGQYVYASLHTKEKYFSPKFILTNRSNILRKSEEDASFLLESALMFKPIIGKIIMYPYLNK